MNYKTHITEIESQFRAAIQTNWLLSSLEHETRYCIQNFSGYLKKHLPSLVISLDEKLHQLWF